MASARKAPALETATGEARWRIPGLTVEQVRSLPASMDFVYAAVALGIPKGLAYEQAKVGALVHGDRRVPVARVGRAYRVLLSDLTRALGIGQEAAAGAC